MVIRGPDATAGSTPIFSITIGIMAPIVFESVIATTREMAMHTEREIEYFIPFPLRRTIENLNIYFGKQAANYIWK